MNCLQFDNRRR